MEYVKEENPITSLGGLEKGRAIRRAISISKTGKERFMIRVAKEKEDERR